MKRMPRVHFVTASFPWHVQCGSLVVKKLLDEWQKNSLPELGAGCRVVDEFVLHSQRFPQVRADGEQLQHTTVSGLQIRPQNQAVINWRCVKSCRLRAEP
jgi:hypothetical protein